ncbi:MAG: HYR domain-containing protein [Spirochaetales bacterium]|nr:HYR domain-containing protein [Spirochaetales bacterium]
MRFLTKAFVVLVLFMNLPLFGQYVPGFGEIETSSNEEFLNIFVHGFSADPFNGRSRAELVAAGEEDLVDLYDAIEADEENKIPDSMVRPKDLLGTRYYLNDWYVNAEGEKQKWDTIKELRAKGNQNIFEYHLFDGMNLETAANLYDDPENLNYMTDVFMRELGDFNTGSALLANGNDGKSYTQQPFIALAKCEWVYRKSMKGLSSDIIIKNVETLLLQGPKFHEMLISPTYLYNKINSLNLDSITTDLAFATELYNIATGSGPYAGTRVPSTIRFTVHSMGGMHLMRFLTEDENSIFGYYKRNSVYSWDDFQNDLTIDSSLVFLMNGQGLSEQAFYEILKYERENVVDKLITVDSPLAGSPLAGVWEALKTDNYINKKIGEFLFIMDIAALDNLVYSYAMFTILTPLLAIPFVNILAAAAMVHFATCIYGDIIFIWISEAIAVYALVTGGIELVKSIFGNKEIHYDSFLPDDFFPITASLFPELKDKQSNGSPGTLRDRYDDSNTPPLTQTPGGKPIEVNTIGMSGPPTMIDSNFGAINNYSISTGYVLEMLAGIFQYRLIFMISALAKQVVVGTVDALLHGLWDGPSYIETLLPEIFSIMGIKYTDGSVVVPHWSSSGETLPVLWNSGNLNAIRFTQSSSNYQGLKSEIGSDFPARDWHSFPTFTVSDRIGVEFLGVHGFSQNILSYPIMKQNSDDGQVFFRDSNMNRKAKVLRSATGKLDIPDLSQRSAEMLGPGTSRVYYNYLMYYNKISKTDVNNIGIIEDISFGNNIQFYTTGEEYTNRGLKPAKITINKTPNTGLTERSYEELDHVIISNVVNILPLYIINYYQGLYLSFINKGNYESAQLYNESIEPKTLVEYAQDIADGVEPLPSNPTLYYNRAGQAVLLNPQFKEGYNQVTFRFQDPFGGFFYKTLDLMQITVPPYVRPVSPLQNQYINTEDTVIAVQALDISEGAVKPESWFNDAEFTAYLDGYEVPNLNLDNANYTISFEEYGLSQGSHIVEIRTSLYGIENNVSWRFWVDTAGPEISFPENILFSNNDKDKSASLLFYVNDEVPFVDGPINYPVDTIYLSSLKAEVSHNGTVITGLKNTNNDRLGAFAEGWNGWVDDSQLDHGVYQLEVEASDRLGNLSQYSHPFTIDREAPILSNLNINSYLLTLETGLLDLSYAMTLDSWEDSGTVNVEVENITTGEVFNLSRESFGSGEEETFTLFYFFEGVNVFKDGQYEIRISTEDALGNTRDFNTFTGIIVDRTRPNIKNAFANPFVVSPGIDTLQLSFDVNESYDVSENLSTQLPLSINLVDNYGNDVPGFAPINDLLLSNDNYDQLLTLPMGLIDGKYFFEISVEDRYGNITKELVSFIKTAVPPEITYPEEAASIQGVTTIHGNVIDPRFDNSLAFDHFELYYQIGIHNLPINYNELSAWDNTGIQVPAYQRNDLWPISWGRFTVENGNILGSIDTTALPVTDGDLITLLVVAEESGGYRIGTVRYFRIMQTTNHVVDVEIDPIYKPGPGDHNFEVDGNLNITYTVNHTIDNPVDVFSYIKDANNKIVKRESYYNLNSTDIIGEPTIDTESGIFVYQALDGHFYIQAQNNTALNINYLIILDSTHMMHDFVDQDGVQMADPLTLLQDGKLLSVSTTVEPYSFYKIGFIVDNAAQLSVIATADMSITDIYIGPNKILAAPGNVTVYPGSLYPPIIWDGKDEFGRYVPNGTYTIGVEVYGNLGGVDEDSIDYNIQTPFNFEIDPVDNYSIQPGLITQDTATVKLHVNKPATFTAEVLNNTDSIVKVLPVTPSSLDNPGIATFSWNGTDEFNTLVENGSYSFRVAAVPADGGPSIVADRLNYPVLGGIEVTTPANLNSTIQAAIFGFTGSDYLNNKQVVQGDSKYQVTVEANGQYVPDRNVDVTLDAVGTQKVEAYPELGYMAALRATYTTLQAGLDISYLKIRDKDWFFGDVYEYRDGDPNKSFSWDAISFIQETNSITKHNLNVDVYASIIVGNPDWPFVPAMSDLTVNAYDWSVNTGTAYVKKNDDLKLNSVSVHSREGSGAFDLRITVKFNFRLTGSDIDLTKADFLANCDGMAFMGPDLSSPTYYIHQTGYAQKGITREATLLTNNIYSDLGVPSAPPGYSRTNLQYRFYYAGENYDNPESDDVTNILNFNPVIYDPANFSGVNSIPVTLGSSDQNNTYTDGKINFNVNVDATRISPIFSLYTHIVKVSVTSSAYDYLAYPFPANEEDFTNGHQIGDQALGIPSANINMNRPGNDVSIPYFTVPALIDSEKNIYFASDVSTSHSYSLSMPFDPLTGYQAELALPEINSILNLPDNVNIKSWLVTDAVSNNIILTGVTGQSINNQNVNDKLIINDSNILSITDAAWSLADDSQTPSDTLETERKDIDLDQLNRYGVLKETRISQLYPFSYGEDHSPRNMFHSDDMGNPIDNNDIIMSDSIPDYSNTGHLNGYDIQVLGLDGNTYKGLTVKNIAYFGEGLKLSDAFVLETSHQSPRKLIAIYGATQGNVTLSYMGEDLDFWNDIPIYNSDSLKNIVTYWDVTGLNGLYTLRLVSEVAGEVNVDFKDVYIGHLLNTGSGTAEISSPGGQSKIIFPEGSLDSDIIVNIDSVDLEDVQDVAIMPDIAPLGKVIKLSTTSENNFTVLPQLQFTFNRTELDELGVNPAELVIYQLREDGHLVAVPTVKELIKVNFDEAGAVISEDILWNSETYTSDTSSINYTYLRAWGTLEHFSYYVVLEGPVEGVPEIDSVIDFTNSSDLNITGAGYTGKVVQVYVTNQMVFNPEGIDPTATTVIDENGKFGFNDLSLPYEGMNYFYFGYLYEGNSELRKVIVKRDTQGPELLVNNLESILSPNNDGRNDKINLSITSSEEGQIDVKVYKQQSNELIKSMTFENIANQTIPALLDGTDLYNNILDEGDYLIKISALDTLGNETVVTRTMVVDLSPAEIVLNSITPMISPANADGILDSVSIELFANEEVSYQAYIGTIFQPETWLISAGTMNGLLNINWNGKGADGNDVESSSYLLTIIATDTAGNKKITSFTQSMILVDNRVPKVTLNIYNNQILVVPFIQNIIITLTSEEADVSLRITDPVGTEIMNQVYHQAVGFYNLIWDGLDTYLDGEYNVSLSLKDAAGNIRNKDFVLNITHDITPPEMTLPENIVIEATGETMPIDIGWPSVEDLSPPITVSNNAPLVFSVGSTEILWTASDRFGNTSYGTQLIDVVDTTPPVVTAPEDIIIEATEIETLVDLGMATATDLFPIKEIIPYAPSANPAVFPLGTTEVLWRAIDKYENAGVDYQYITVVDTTAPELVIPADITAEAEDLETVVDIGMATATDIFDYVITNDAPSSFILGSTNITWTATDVNGNSISLIQVVTIIDTTAPVLTVPADIVKEAEAFKTAVSLGEASATDIYGVTILNDAPLSFLLGITEVTWTATDDNGNVSRAIQIIEITDTTPPVLTTPSDVNMEATGEFTPIELPSATAIDLVDGNVAVTSNALSNYPIGTTNVTFTASDLSGNSVTAITKVTVYDQIAPEIIITGVINNQDYTETATPVITITDMQSGIANQTVTLDGASYSSGIEVTTLGHHTLVVSASDYAGNTTENIIEFSIYAITSITLNATSVQYSDKTLISASLSAREEAIAGKTLSLKIDDNLIGTAITDVNGEILFTETINLPAGTYPVEVSFVQDNSLFLRATHNETDLIVTTETIQVIYNGDFIVQYPNSFTLKATISDEDDGFSSNLALGQVLFTVYKKNADNSLSFTGSYPVDCDNTGVAVLTQSLVTGFYMIHVDALNTGYFAETSDEVLTVIYNAEAGSASSGGWVDVTNSAYGTLGKAIFNFSIKFKNDLPDGHFQIKQSDENINFNSISIDWFIVENGTAQFEGTGTMKNSSNLCKFRVNCIENNPDSITIMLWDGINTNETPIYSIINHELNGGTVNIKNK